VPGGNGVDLRDKRSDARSYTQGSDRCHLFFTIKKRAKELCYSNDADTGLINKRDDRNESGTFELAMQRHCPDD